MTRSSGTRITRPTITVDAVEKQIREYLNCWEKNPPFFNHSSPSTKKDGYYERVITPCEQNFLITAKTEGMHLLEYEAFRKMPILLLETQLHQINHDHFYYWAFAVDVYDFLLFSYESPTVYDKDTRDRLHLIMDVLFLSSRQLDLETDRRIIREKVRKERVLINQTPRLLHVAAKAFLITAHLVYPLIEGIARRLLPSLVSLDGTVKTTIPSFENKDGGTVKKYDVKIRNRVNAIDDILRILEKNTADEQLKMDLESYREFFDHTYSRSLGKPLRTYDLISKNRNALLHGEELFQTLYAALINLVCVLLNSLISKSEYDSKFNEIQDRIEYNRRLGEQGLQQGYYPLW